ncbi:MAG: hypothetical protein K6A23_05130 [Butyrivibrio sp.]|nr:hypothetical protein [Butyrivibrio sp.]
MPKKLKEVYSAKDLKEGVIIAGTILYSFLDDNIVSEETKKQIMKKLYLPSNASLTRHYEPDVIQNVYGKYEVDKDGDQIYGDEAIMTSIMQSDNGTLSEDYIDVAGGYLKNAYLYYLSDDTDDMMEYYKNSLQELSKLLKDNESNIIFESNAEHDYFKYLQQKIDILANGESLNDRYKTDMAEGLLWNYNAKVRFKSAEGSIYNNEFVPVVSDYGNNLNTHEFFKKIEKTGIVQAIVGETNLHNKFEEHIKNGSVGRAELIEEAVLQKNRLNKFIGMTKEEFEPYRELFDGDYENLLGENMGIKETLYDAEAKQKILSYGWPVEDVPALTFLYRTLKETSSAIADIEKSAQELKDKGDNLSEEEKNQLKDLNDKITAFNELKSCWNNVENTNNITLDSRQRLMDRIIAITDESIDSNSFKYCRAYAQKAKDRVLSTEDKILMAGSLRDMYNILEEDDPRLMRSSSQFRKMKKNLEKYVNISEKLENTTNYSLEKLNDNKYRVQRDETIAAIEEYLTYKSMELKDPKKSHKRSALETRRIKDAEALLYRIKYEDSFEKKQLLSEEKEVKEKKNARIMPSRKESSYEKYMELYTGYYEINTSNRILVDNVAKVMAVTKLHNDNKDADIVEEEVTRLAKEYKEKYLLEVADVNDLKEAIKNPEKLHEFGENNIKNISSLGDMVTNDKGYEDYIKYMRELYKNITSPERKAPEYQNIFNAVEEIAYLPLKLKGLDVDEIQKTLENNTAKILVNANKFLNDHPKHTGIEDEIFYVLRGVTKRAGRYNLDIASCIQTMVDKTNEKRGVTDIQSKDYVDLEDGYKVKKIQGTNLRDVEQEKYDELNKRYIINKKAVEDNNGNINQIADEGRNSNIELEALLPEENEDNENVKEENPVKQDNTEKEKNSVKEANAEKEKNDVNVIDMNTLVNKLPAQNNSRNSNIKEKVEIFEGKRTINNVQKKTEYKKVK